MRGTPRRCRWQDHRLLTSNPESHYATYPNLQNMTALLDLREQSNINKPKLQDQVQAVFNITRLI